MSCSISSTPMPSPSRIEINSALSSADSRGLSPAPVSSRQSSAGPCTWHARFEPPLCPVRQLAGRPVGVGHEIDALQQRRATPMAAVSVVAKALQAEQAEHLMPEARISLLCWGPSGSPGRHAGNSDVLETSAPPWPFGDLVADHALQQ